MTVCIAAICYWAPNSSAIIVASDHMVTLGSFIQYEHDNSKIRFITPRVCALTAGDSLGATSLTARMIAKHGPTSTSTVEDVANDAKLIYEEMRRDALNTEVFHPRGITLDEFYQTGIQSSLAPHLVGGIDDEVMSYDLGVEIVIAGTDKSGAHIYTVGNPGTLSNYQDLGYVAIGSGGIHATQSLIGFRHSQYHSLYETIFSVYASKKRSEAAPGVGPETDLIIIPPPDKAGWMWLQREQLDKLDGLYREFIRPPGEAAKMVAELELFGPEERENESENQPAERQAGASPEPDAPPVHP